MVAVRIVINTGREKSGGNVKRGDSEKGWGKLKRRQPGLARVDERGKVSGKKLEFRGKGTTRDQTR